MLRIWSVFLILLLLYGCVGVEEGVEQAEPPPDIPLEGNQILENVGGGGPEPQVSIAITDEDPRVPYYPTFSYSCYDPDGNLLYCNISIDGEQIYSWGPYPQNVNWPQNFSMEPIRSPGKHTISIEAVDDEGNFAEDSESFNVRGTLRVYVQELPPGVDASYLDALREAFSYWEDRLGISFIEVDSGEDIYIDWAKEYAGETIGRAEIGGKNMIVGLGDSYCHGKYRPYSKEAVRNIAIHELGHILGYEHVDDPQDYMNPIIPGIKYSIDIEEEPVIPSGWYFYYEVCANSPSRYSFEVSSDYPVNVYVLPDIGEVDKVVNGEVYSYVEGCKEKNVRYFNRECNVPKDAVIMVWNKGREASSVSIRAINIG